MAWIRLESNFCVYCGAVADSDEHFPPKSDAISGVIFPACRECNSIAGTIWPHDFRKRAEYVTAHLTKKYCDEIDRLDEEITRCQRKRNQLSERLAWNAVSHISSIDTGNIFAQNDAEDFIILDCDLDWSESIDSTCNHLKREEDNFGMWCKCCRTYVYCYWPEVLEE